MKRQIVFKVRDSDYYLEENGSELFSINASDLKFNSISFYNGIYKGKNPYIHLENGIDVDPYKKGKYIFTWLSEIVTSINSAFPDDAEEAGEIDKQHAPRIIHLYEFSACAGDGFYIDEHVPYGDHIDPTGKADFATTIAGDSMEPTVHDKSIIYIKQVEDLEHNDIGLFVVNGEVMCKRFLKVGRGFKLSPDNKAYSAISGKNLTDYRVLGKVISYE